MRRYKNSTLKLSPVHHPDRPETRGLVIHWTAGHEAGDIAALTGGHVDVHFYVTKAGKVFQILDADSEAWHAFATANDTCVGIEHEGSGEPYTEAQLAASANLAAWVCKTYKIPVKHVDPHHDWHGIMGHADLHGIDGNDHTDTVPAGTGWDRYLAAIEAGGKPAPKPKPHHLPTPPNVVAHEFVVTGLALTKAQKARRAALADWAQNRLAAGWSWRRIKATKNWAQYVQLGGQ